MSEFLGALPMKPIYLCTTSNSKLEQFRAFFAPRGYEVRQVVLEIPETQSVDPAAVVLQKIQSAAQLSALRPLVVDDAGLELPALDGFPGALLKPILELGRVRLLKNLATVAQENGRANARLVSAIAVDTGSALLEAKGCLDGVLDFRDEARWDDKDSTAVFYPRGDSVSLKQLKETMGEAAFSHRFDALSSIWELLESRCRSAELMSA